MDNKCTIADFELEVVSNSTYNLPTQAQSINSNASIKNLIPNQVKFVHADKFWEQGYKGNGVKVAVLDTGISSHYALNSAVKGGLRFVTDNSGNTDTSNYTDKHGHGTHVASIIGARPDGTHQCMYGLAPECDLYIGKILDDKGQGTVTQMVSGIEWAIEQGVDIINMSVSYPSYSTALENAVKKAVNNNILVIVASGNGGDGTSITSEISYPAYYNESVAVGAIDFQSQITDFSNSNNQIDCVGTGYKITGCYLNNTYALASGTSQAAPVVAGFLALLLQKFRTERGRTPSEVELYAYLIRHCRDLNLDYREQGFGCPKFER